MNMMKQYTFYPNQGQQILARILLTIWLPVMCNPEITLAAPQSESPVLKNKSNKSNWFLVDPLLGARQGEHQQGSDMATEEGSDQENWTYVLEISKKGKENTNPVDDQGQSAPHQEVIQWLSNSGVPQGDHQEALNVAAAQGEVAQAQEILTQVSNVAAENKLRIAAAQGEVAQVERILTTQDININAVDEHGWSALHWAVMAGHKEVAGRLIRHGADVALKDYQENKTPLDYASKSDSKYFSAIAALVKLFSTLGGPLAADVIAAEVIQHKDAIDQHLDRILKYLEKLEHKKDQEYQHFKHRYHIQKAKYLKFIGEEDDASDQEKIAEEFQPLPPQSLDADEQQELEAQIASGTEETCATDDAVAHIQKLLEDISAQGILDEGIYNQLKNFVATAQEVPRNFSSYCHISTARETFTVQIAEGLQQCNDSSQNPENNKLTPQIEQVQNLSAALEAAVIETIDVNRITFIQNTLALPEKTMDTFFSDALSTKEDVNSRYETLTFHFDPTKAKWIPEAYHKDAQALMSLITFCRDELLESPISAARYQSGGDSAWRKFKDYEYGQQGQWDQLTILKRGDLESLTSDQIDASKIKHAKAAYQYYRAGSRKVAKDDLKSQIQFRNSMALCLAALGKPLAAHLYALAAVNLAENDSEDQTKANKILKQIKAGTLVHHGRGAATREPLDEGDEALAYLEMLAGNIILFKNAQGLVSYQASEEEILQASKQADRYIWGIPGSSFGGMLGGMVAPGLFEGATGVAIGATSLPLIVFGFLALGVGGSIYCIYQSEKLNQEINIRQALHSMIAKAIECYKQGQMQKFLNVLSNPYAMNVQLLSLEELGERSGEKKIIDLLASGIRPEAVAGLFQLIARALLSDEVSLPRSNKLKPYIAINILWGALNEKLAEAAKNLDASVSEIRRQIKETDPWFHKLSDFSQPQQKYLAPEHRTAAQEMPFSARLDSVRNAAKLNIALLHIAISHSAIPNVDKMKKGDMKEVQDLAKEVQNSIDKYGQFHTAIAKQLKAIKEIVWILSGQSVDSAPNVTNEVASDLPPSEEATGDAYLDQLNEKLKQLDEKLKQAKLPEERLKIYNQKAATYIKKAKVIHSESESLQNWQLAEKNYTRAMQLRKYDLTAYLGYAQCLIELSKYNRAVRYLKKHPQIKGTSALWIMTSRAYSKQGDSTKAKECILEALQLDPQSQEALDEKKFIEKLQHVEHSNTAPPKFSPLSKIS